MTSEQDLFIRAAGELAAQEAERLWQLDVFDPPIGSKHPRAPFCLDVIEGIIKTAGWGFATPYRGNGAPQWCGMFAANCWLAAGLDPASFATYWASTYRLLLWLRYQKFDAKHPNPPPAATEPHRLLTSVGHGFKPRFTPRRGDIVIVGDGEPEAGDHVTILIGYDEARMEFDTISGNGGGVGPRGDRREGISRKTYSIDQGGYRVMHIGRPAPGDVVTFSVER